MGKEPQISRVEVALVVAENFAETFGTIRQPQLGLT
jgi:hypothetical protein